MLLHPVFRTLATRPELLAEHVGAYTELALAEAADAGAGLRRKLLLGAAAAASAALGVALAGGAALLAAAIPLATMPAPWALLAAPALPLAAAAVLFALQRRQPVDLGFRTLRGQLALDRVLWQQFSEP
ncbi:MAG: hypothetical protein U1F56_08340 [Rubrivivax sp.]